MAGVQSTFAANAKTNAANILKGVTDTIRDGLNAAKDAAVKLVTGLSKVFTVLNPILSGVASLAKIMLAPFVALKLGLQSIVYGFTVVADLFKVFASILRGVFDIVGGLFNVLKSVGSAIGSLFNAIFSHVGTLAGHVHSHFGTILKYALGTAAGIAAAFAGAALAAEHAWLPVSQTIGRLKIGGAGSQIDGLRKFALDMSRAMVISTADVLTLAEKALHLKVPADQLKNMTAAAVGLASALGISASEAMEKLAGASGTALAKLKTFAAQGIDLAAQKVSTFTGLWQSFKNVLSNNAQVLGEKIAPGIAKIVDAIRPLLGLLESNGEAFARVFNGMAEVIAPAITKLVGWFAQGAAAVVAFGQTISADWGRTWEYVKTSLEYYVAEILGAVSHFFTSQLPSVFNWFKTFSAEWVAALGEGLRSAFDNMWLNLADGASVGWELMKQKFDDGLGLLGQLVIDGLAKLSASFNAFSIDPVGFKLKSIDLEKELTGATTAVDWGKRFTQSWSRSLADGFKSVKMPGLPDLAGRAQSPEQAALLARMKALGKEMGADFVTNFDKQLAGFNAILGGKGGANIKDQIAGFNGIGKKGAGAHEGGGNNLLESRFLTRGPGGISPELKVQQDILAATRQADANADSRWKQAAAERGRGLQQNQGLPLVVVG